MLGKLDWSAIPFNEPLPLVSAAVVTTLGILNLDDVSSKIGKRLRASRPCNDASKIHDQKTVQRGRGILCAR